MKAELLHLLCTRGVRHPSRIGSVQIFQGGLRLAIEGYRWWDKAGGDGGRAELVFEDVQFGSLDAELLAQQDDETLENLHAVPLAETPWAFSGVIHTTYCQQAVPEPLAIYQAVHDLLVEARAPCGTADYLNEGHGMARFSALTRNTNFQLSEAPTPVHELVAAELRQQGVSHNVLTHARAQAEGLHVILGDASFICGAAHVHWD